MREPLWQVLVASVGIRSSELSRQLDALAAQLPDDGSVQVVVYWDDFDVPLGVARQRLLDHATARYVNFVDDDDELPGYYVQRVVEALASAPGYVGWRQQLYWNGEATKPTFHSLRYDRWWDDADGYYRHVSHLNPIRRDLAMRGRFDHGVPEDVDWAEQVYAAIADEHVPEVFIDDVMYLYRYDPARSLWSSRPTRATGPHRRPLLPSPHTSYHPSSNRGLAE